MAKQKQTNLTVSRVLLESLVPRKMPVNEEYQLVRPDDQLHLRFQLINGEVDRSSNTIVGLKGEEPIYYAIWLGPQHRVEAPITPGGMPKDFAGASRIAGESRIVVEIPNGTPFTVATLLDLAAYALVLDDRALPEAKPNDLEPDASVTAIEVPTSLVLSPTTGNRFVAGTQAITHGDVTELWRARLGRVVGNRVIEPPRREVKARAIWQRPEDPGFVPPRPLDHDDRRLLVEQTTGEKSQPISVKQLWLSSQGAFFDAEGEWAEGTLTAYRQRVITGRDLHVEVVKRGYLTPFGHPASITTLTERQFLKDESGETTAVLISEDFLTIGAGEVCLDSDSIPFIPYQGRGTPFVKVTASDSGSGEIGARQVVLANGANITIDKGYVLTRGGEDLRIAFSATDRSGQEGICFEMPTVFITEDVAYQSGKKTALNKLNKWFDERGNQDFVTAGLNSQPIAWADPPEGSISNRAGSVQTTTSICFGLDLPGLHTNDPVDVEAELEASGRPAFYPAVRSARIVDLAVSTNYGGASPELEVNIAQRYLEHGSGDNNIDLGYLDLPTPNVVIPTTEATGMMSLGLKVATFGQRTGGGIDFSGGTWDPADALAELFDGFPKLLGAINLADIISSIEDLSLDLSDRGLPTMSVEPIVTDNGIPSGACFHFQWEPEIHSFPKEGDKTFVVTADFGGGEEENDEDKMSEIPANSFGVRETRALLDIRTCTDGTQTFEVSLERFALLVPPKIPVVALLFERLRYRNVQNNGSATADISDWFFINQLGWLEPVKDLLLDVLGLGTPMFEGGIFIDFDLPLPGLTLGVVGIHGIQLGLDINMPDSGASSLGFALSSQEDPFIVTIMGFGGNGSFSLALDSKKIVYVKGSTAVMFELAVNVFVVSAAVSVSLGTFIIYEVNKQDQGEVTLGAYATVAGAISIIGLVKISGAVTVALIYNVTTKVLRGVASVTGEVSAVVFKGTATHDVEVKVALGDDSNKARRLAASAGSDNSASFGDRYSSPQWDQYCKAFAD
ncbi:MAG: hypothetical protein NPIRA02_05820 [Nitrospirales bacterium]|nr:MAG: hypothetical protein NPIRA02_05820 [Nitrospirales bacterium]